MTARSRFLAVLRGLLAGALALAGAIAVTDGRAGVDAEGVTRAQADEIVRAHNAWRGRAGVLPLRWAADLAARAQARAGYLAAHGCVIEHGLLPDDVGENLYWAGPLRAEGRKDQLSGLPAAQVVDAWGAESTDYDPAHGTCAWKRQCGHYTQIVWAATQEVGCGMSVCPTLGQVWVCNYRPGGNVRILMGTRRPAAAAPALPAPASLRCHHEGGTLLSTAPGASRRGTPGPAACREPDSRRAPPGSAARARAG